MAGIWSRSRASWPVRWLGLARPRSSMLAGLGKCLVIFVHPFGVLLVGGYVLYAGSERICGVAVLADAKLGKADI